AVDGHAELLAELVQPLGDLGLISGGEVRAGLRGEAAERHQAGPPFSPAVRLIPSQASAAPPSVSATYIRPRTAPERWVAPNSPALLLEGAAAGCAPVPPAPVTRPDGCVVDAIVLETSAPLVPHGLLPMADATWLALPDRSAVRMAL